MENTTTQTNQKFSAANKKSLKVGQELTEHGLIWRKLQDGTGVWRYDFRMNKRRFKGVLGKESEGVTLSAARNQLKELKAVG